ncbi:CcdB family protein [Methylophaga sp.]|uniref:CcdB family protein n=1 Tax=Methylophaga sp. TaxID=2024840 RepID=UPI0039AF4E7F
MQPFGRRRFILRQAPGLLKKQFDLYENTDPESRGRYPYFVDVQTDLLKDLNSRVVIPTSAVHDTNDLPKNLCPIVEIRNKKYVLLTTKLLPSQHHF